MSRIGILDSGVGGLSVWRELVRLLPKDDLLYFADSTHLPYGVRPAQEVRGFTTEIVRFLITQGAQVIVIACNTMSIAALKTLREQIPSVPFVGMEPAIKVAASLTQNNTIGIMATQGTLKGQMYHDLITRFAGGMKVIAQACPGLVEAVERGALEDPDTDALLRTHLQPFLDGNADQVVLGCTHYPFLRPAIERLANRRFALIDPAPAVAKHTLHVKNDLISPSPVPPPPAHQGKRIFYTTGTADAFTRSAAKLLEWDPRSVPDVRAMKWSNDILEQV